MQYDNSLYQYSLYKTINTMNTPNSNPIPNPIPNHAARQAVYVSDAITSLLDSPEMLEELLRSAIIDDVFSENECHAVITEARKLVQRLGGGERYHTLTGFFNAVTQSLAKVR
jgi:hypothetical protein